MKISEKNSVAQSGDSSAKFAVTLAALRDKKASIGVVGLGYVGLPLACLLARHFNVVGFDIKASRVDELRKGIDRTDEVTDSTLLKQKTLSYTTDKNHLRGCAVLIVAVPTPVDEARVPDLRPVINASKMVGEIIERGTVVVYESTVYPGVTDGPCAEAIEAASKFVAGKDYYLGYSPERISPGDRERTLERIVKIVSGSDEHVTNFLAEIYGTVITAGIYKAASIRTAEAAKVIENAQRDLNIAFVNEISMLFDRIGLDTLEVLEAAGTKWNFLPFRPGLVGGHCIDVDPYYLSHLANRLGFHTQVINSGRRINDAMAPFVAQKCMQLIMGNPGNVQTPVRIGILGVTFKENVPDVRNTKVVRVAESLETFGAKTYLFDPVADSEEFSHEYERNLCDWATMPQCDALILAVKHKVFLEEFPLERLMEKLGHNKIVLDLKGAIDRKSAEKLGIHIWRL